MKNIIIPRNLVKEIEEKFEKLGLQVITESCFEKGFVAFYFKEEFTPEDMDNLRNKALIEFSGFNIKQIEELSGMTEDEKIELKRLIKYNSLKREMEKLEKEIKV